MQQKLKIEMQREEATRNSHRLFGIYLNGMLSLPFTIWNWQSKAIEVHLAGERYHREKRQSCEEKGVREAIFCNVGLFVVALLCVFVLQNLCAQTTSKQNAKPQTRQGLCVCLSERTAVERCRGHFKLLSETQRIHSYSDFECMLDLNRCQLASRPDAKGREKHLFFCAKATNNRAK
jgi:hypothetical protein